MTTEELVIEQRLMRLRWGQPRQRDLSTLQRHMKARWKALGRAQAQVRVSGTAIMFLCGTRGGSWHSEYYFDHVTVGLCMSWDKLPKDHLLNWEFPTLQVGKKILLWMRKRLETYRIGDRITINDMIYGQLSACSARTFMVGYLEDNPQDTDPRLKGAWYAQAYEKHVPVHKVRKRRKILKPALLAPHPNALPAPQTLTTKQINRALGLTRFGTPRRKPGPKPKAK